MSSLTGILSRPGRVGVSWVGEGMGGERDGPTLGLVNQPAAATKTQQPNPAHPCSSVLSHSTITAKQAGLLSHR